jgi:hypothetical protein
MLKIKMESKTDGEPLLLFGFSHRNLDLLPAQGSRHGGGGKIFIFADVDEAEILRKLKAEGYVPEDVKVTYAPDSIDQQH